MYRWKLHHVILLGASAAAAIVAVLWSWNTLAALFALPAAQARHALAAVVIALALRAVLWPRGRRRHGSETRP